MADNRDEARDLVRREMARRRWVNADLVREAGIDSSTVSDFLSGKRWPRGDTLAKIDSALEWEPGTLSGVSRGDRGSGFKAAMTQLGLAMGVLERRPTDDADIVIRFAAENTRDLSQIEVDLAKAAASMAFLAKVREFRREHAIDRQGGLFDIPAEAEDALLQREEVGSHGDSAPTKAAGEEPASRFVPPAGKFDPMALGLAVREGKPENPPSTVGEEPDAPSPEPSSQDEGNATA